MISWFVMEFLVIMPPIACHECSNGVQHTVAAGSTVAIACTGACKVSRKRSTVRHDQVDVRIYTHQGLCLHRHVNGVPGCSPLAPVSVAGRMLFDLRRICLLVSLHTHSLVKVQEEGGWGKVMCRQPHQCITK